MYADDLNWRKMQAQRKRQRIAGCISGIFLAIALIALFDGLLAQMRAGSNELEMLAGQSMTISGPIPLKNPLDSDVRAEVTPQSDLLSFKLEGFFTGYWFGNGMWRGKIVADPDIEPDTYFLRVAFKGAPAQTAQKYVLKVFATAQDQRAASLSYIKRFFGLNAFILAAVSATAGILAGLATYFFGRRYILLLTKLHLAEIYFADAEDGEIWCFANKVKNIEPGAIRLIIDQDGSILGEAEARELRKGRMRLIMQNGGMPTNNAFVYLKPLEKDVPKL